VHEAHASRIEQADATAGGRDEGGHRPADPVEHRGDVEPGRDELAGAVERGQLLRPAAALVHEPPLLDRRGQRAREIGDDLDVGLVEGGALRGGERDGAEHAAAADQRHQQRRAVALGGELPAARFGHGVGGHVVDAHRRRPGRDRRDEGVFQRQPRVARRHTAHRPGEDVDHAEGATLGVEQRHRHGFVPHQPRQSLGEAPEDVVERVTGHQQAGDLVEDGDPQRALLQAPHLFDGGAELATERAGQRHAGAAAGHECQLADGAARRAEPCPARAHPLRYRPAAAGVAQQGARPPGAGRHGHALAARGPIGQGTGLGAGETHEPPQRERERLLDRGRAAEPGEQIGKHAADLHGCRTLPGRLPVCSPSLMTKRPFTSTCSMPTG